MVRKPLGSSAAAAGIAGSGAFLFMQAMAQDKVNINMQFGRIAGGQQIGEGMARQLGYQSTEGMDFAIQIEEKSMTIHQRACHPR